MKLSDKAKTVLSTVAGALGTAIGGPFGPMAGALVAAALGTQKPDGSPDQAATEAALLNATPDQLLALKNAEQAFQVKLEELGIQREQLAYNDAADARARDKAYVTAGAHNWRADFLAASAMLTFGVSLWAVFNFEMPAANRDVIVYLLGALTVIVKDLYGFEFGSSRSSADKTAAMADAIKRG
jgi:hypothetical protein